MCQWGDQGREGEKITQTDKICTLHYITCRKIQNVYGTHSNTTISMRLRMRKLTMATGQSSVFTQIGAQWETMYDRSVCPLPMPNPEKTFC